MSARTRGPKQPDGSSLVYSTEGGRLCRNCGQPVARCRCRHKAPAETAASDGRVRVRRELKGRRGKTVTTVSGVPVPASELRALAAELKRHCGSGGALKAGVIEIQGDHCDKVVAFLVERGHRAVRSGG